MDHGPAVFDMLTGANNRVRQSIERIEAMMAEKPDAEAKLEASFARLSRLEYRAYQEAKSRAQASGVLSFEEAQTVYRILVDWGTAPLSWRLAVTQLMAELMGVR